jgi:hypothetical protein
MRELYRELVVAKRRTEDEHDERMTLAWTIAGLSRQKKLPNLKTLLAKRKPRPQTAGEMRTILHMLAGQYGGRLRKARVPRG